VKLEPSHSLDSVSSQPSPLKFLHCSKSASSLIAAVNDASPHGPPAPEDRLPALPLHAPQANQQEMAIINAGVGLRAAQDRIQQPLLLEQPCRSQDGALLVRHALFRSPIATGQVLIPVEQGSSHEGKSPLTLLHCFWTTCSLYNDLNPGAYEP
jgi:hypothetical protein